ncbi:hypothetical protein G7Y79_00065g094450 [Physcia stellaris]|nr:hypothetical protein G7Y79_00065g094450 [Physcia stellaris]
MASWQVEYLAGLEERDRKEKANLEFYSAYTKLADRAAKLDVHAKSEPVIAESTDNTQTLKDLSEAQRSKGVMQSRLDTISDEIQKLKLQSQHDGRRIQDLSTEKATLSIRMKDQDEELRGKAKLLDDVHDENLSLTLQLNLAEERAKNLQTENKELVDRWMTRMGKEAEDLNKASKFS